METASVFPKCERADKILALVYFFVGYGFVYLFLGATMTGSLAVYTVFYVAVVLTYLKLKNITPPRESWFWLAVVLAIGIPFSFWSVLELFQMLLLMCAAAYWTLAASGRLVKGGRTSEWVMIDCWNAFLWVPFANFTSQFQVLFGRYKMWALEDGQRKLEEAEAEQGVLPVKREKSGLSILLGLMLTLPVLVIVLPLLSRADAGFESLLGGAGRFIQEHFLETILRMVVSIPVSLYLYGLVFGGVTGRNTEAVSVAQLEQAAKDARRVPNITVCTVLIVLGLIYLLFIGLQGSYLFSAFAGHLPQEFTYAEYARRGFFELCQIGAWNLVILSVGSLVSQKASQDHKGLKWMILLVSVQTLLLIVTAISKLGMYIAVYGLTVNRVLPMVFMIWLTVVFVSLILRQTREFPQVRLCVMVGAVLVCLLCVFPIENWIAAYNAWANLG